MDSPERTEIVPFGRAIWQSDRAKSYYCESCGRWIRSQYEGEDSPEMICNGAMSPHILKWTASSMPEPPDYFEMIAERLTNIIWVAAKTHADTAAPPAVIEALREVWNARGAADIDVVRCSLIPDVTKLEGALRKLDSNGQ